MAFNPGGGGNISSASDVAFSNPANQQVVGYNASTAKWQNQSLHKDALNVLEYGALGNGISNDNAAIQAACAAAYASDATLHWPKGTYLTTASIPNLHLVMHTGSGVIKRGADLFTPAPDIDDTNTIYVNPNTGYSDTSDGLTAATAFRKVQAAISAVAQYGPMLEGAWTLQLAAGTYPERVTVPKGLAARNTLTIVGPAVGNHPTIPTALFSQGLDNGAVAIRFYGPLSLTIKDIKFAGYNGTTSSTGISAGDDGYLYAVNCHFDDCFYGASGQSSNVDIKGGIFDRCGRMNDGLGVGAGVRSLMKNRHSIGTQNAATLSLGPIFRNCRYGVWAQENSTGHIDWSTFEDNEDGVVLRVNSRANLDGSTFRRNARDIRADSNAHVFISANTSFSTGANESDSKLILNSGAQVTSSAIFGHRDAANSTTTKLLDSVFPNATINTLSSTVFYTAPLKAPFWRDNTSASLMIKKRLTFTIHGTMAGTIGFKRILVRLGATNTNVTFTATETGAFICEGHVYFTGNTTQFLQIRGERHLGTNVRIGQANASEAMTADTNLTLEGLVENSADTVSISVVDFSWAG